MSKKRLVITGSEGLIGSRLTKHFESDFEVLKLDKQLGHDLADEAFVSDWFKEHTELYGMIVCHAYNPLPLKNTVKVDPIDQPLDEIRDYLEVNIVSAFHVCSQFIRHNTEGSIINISGLYGVVSPKHHIYNNYVKPIGYSLSKSAIITMSKYLSTYYAPKFRINTVILGGVFDKRFDQQFVDNYNNHVPMGRMMDIDEVPGIFDYLLDEKSTYASGSEFIIDGGWMAW